MVVVGGPVCIWLGAELGRVTVSRFISVYLIPILGIFFQNISQRKTHILEKIQPYCRCCVEK